MRLRTGLGKTLLPDVLEPEQIRMITVIYVRSVTYTFNSLRTNSAWWAVTRRTLRNHKTVKIGGGHLCGDGRLPGTVWYITCQLGSHIEKKMDWLYYCQCPQS